MRVPSWLPNVISVVRIALVPMCVLMADRYQDALVAGSPTGGTPGEPPAGAWNDPARLPPVAVFVAIGASDLLDGWLARRFDLASPTGAFLDALADKLAQVALLAFFVLAEGPAYAVVPVWFFALVIGRDLFLAAGSLMVRHRRGCVVVRHKWHGKASSSLLFVITLWILAGLPAEWSMAVFGTATAIIVASTADYARDGWLQWVGTE